MKAKALEIRWHDTKPIFSVDVQPGQPKDHFSRSGKEPVWRVATAGGDKLVRIWLLHARPAKKTKVAPQNALVARKMNKEKVTDNDDDEIEIIDVGEDLEVEVARPEAAQGKAEPERTAAAQEEDIKGKKTNVEDSVDNPRVEYLATLKQHTGVVNVVRFAPVSDTLASAGDDGNIIFWVPGESSALFGESAEDRMYEKESWRVKSMLRSKSGQEIYDMAWSPDASYIVAGSVDHMVNVYDVASGHLLHSIAEHTNYVQGVAWDPLNAYIATESSDRTMHVYSLSHSHSSNGSLALQNINKNSRIHLPPQPERSRSISRDGSTRRASSTSSSLEFLASLRSPAIPSATPLASDAISDSEMSEISIASSSTTNVRSMDPPKRRTRIASSPRVVRSPSPAPPPPAVAVGSSRSVLLSPKAIRTIPTAPDEKNSHPAPPPAHRLYSDANSTPFFRRLAWSPDGSLLLTPAGQYNDTTANPPQQKPTVHIYTRSNIGKPPVAHLPGHRTTSVAVHFSPVLFALRPSSEPPVFILPYRMLYAVLTLDAIYLYDTQATSPLYVFGNFHYAPFTDVSWTGDGLGVIVSSQDGYCSVVSFEPGELGEVYDGQPEKPPHWEGDLSQELQSPSATVIPLNALPPFGGSDATQGKLQPPPNTLTPRKKEKMTSMNVLGLLQAVGPQSNEKSPQEKTEGDTSGTSQTPSENAESVSGKDSPPRKKKKVALTFLGPL